jgi:hypothetical protein
VDHHGARSFPCVGDGGQGVHFEAAFPFTPQMQQLLELKMAKRFALLQKQEKVILNWR